MRSNAISGPLEASTIVSSLPMPLLPERLAASGDICVSICVLALCVDPSSCDRSDRLTQEPSLIFFTFAKHQPTLLRMLSAQPGDERWEIRQHERCQCHQQNCQRQRTRDKYCEIALADR